MIGTPLALASESYAEKAWVNFDDVPAIRDSPIIRFIHGSVDKVDPEKKTAEVIPHGSSERTQLNYDYFLTATGLRRVWPVVPQSLRREEYLSEARGHIEKVQNARHGVVVVGGGMSYFALDTIDLHPHFHPPGPSISSLDRPGHIAHLLTMFYL